ncbi:hypothetical protein ACH5A3_32975 [Streptomyces echinatus]|uniref:hypothetical protein n=1 Tax=Streptomyces echinatus TaxID=67293 RepID=UPI0037A45093
MLDAAARVLLGIALGATVAEKAIEHSLGKKALVGGVDGAKWTMTATSQGPAEFVLDAVEHHEVFTNSAKAAVKIERTVTHVWSRSVTWNIGGEMEGTAGFEVERLIEAKLKAAFDIHRASETSDRHVSSQKIEVSVPPGAHVQAVGWYREEHTGEFTVSGPGPSGAPECLTVPYRAVLGMTSQVHTTDVSPAQETSWKTRYRRWLPLRRE